MDLLQNQSTSCSASLSLYSTLTLLLSPILHQPLAPIPPIATYLSQHLLTALAPPLQLQLADIILDLVWQLDTQIEEATRFLHLESTARERLAEFVKLLIVSSHCLLASSHSS